VSAEAQRFDGGEAIPSEAEDAGGPGGGAAVAREQAEPLAEPCHRKWPPFDDEECKQPKDSLATNLGGGLSSG